MRNLFIIIIVLLISSIYISDFLQDGKERKTKSLYDVTIENKTYPSVDINFGWFSSNISFNDPNTNEFISSDNYTLKEIEVPLSEEEKSVLTDVDFLLLILNAISAIVIGLCLYRFVMYNRVF